MRIAIDNGLKGKGNYEFQVSVSQLLITEISKLRGVQSLRLDNLAEDKCIELANKWGADLYIALRTNSFDDTKAEGIETLIYTSRPKKAEEVAAYIQSQLIRETGRKNRGIKTSDNAILKKTNMAAVMPMMGFYTNVQELRLMKNPDFQLKCAAAILNGIEEAYNITPITEKIIYVVTGDNDKMKKLAEELADRGFIITAK